MDCVWTILSFLTEPVINYVKGHGAYVIRYKNKVDQLKQENKELGEKKKRIQKSVDRATINGEAFVTEDVSNWLKDAEDMEGAVTNFLRPQENGESCVCIPGCMCPNLICRYKTGKEADDKKEKVINLKKRGDELEKSPLTCDAPFDFKLKFDSSKYYTTFQSRASVVEDIKNALNDSGVDMIGVHGPGGAGKTTMVKEVVKEAKNRGIFDKIVLAVVSNDPNTSKLQGDLLLQLDINYKQTSELGRADVLRKALSDGKRKVLVILDDLWQVLDLNEFGIPISGLGDRGCKILLTSRREEVFKGMEVRLYFRIGYLEEREAWELFKKVTGDFRVNVSIARKVNKRCGGLPLAIVAVGATLKDEEEFEWCNALQQLENSPLKYIEGIDRASYTPLKLSYDFLKEKDAKSCFLLCCLFPEDAEISIDDLVRYSFALGFLEKVDTLKAARYRVQAMVNMLRRSCLLLNGKEENFVKMHDVIRDLAISITKDKQTKHDSGHDWPGQQQFMVDHNIRRLPRNDAWKSHTAISLRNNDNFTFPCSVLDCPLVHTLVLKRGKSLLVIPNDFFQGMKEARVIDLEGMCLELQSSIWALDNLRMLSINYCYLSGGLSRIQNLKNHLEILSIADSYDTLPRDIEELTLLRSLDLRNCEDLRVIPKGVISKLIHLEELYVTEKFYWWDTTVGGGMSNASINELNSLTQLSVLHVAMLTESFKIMVLECHDLFEKLTNFAININGQYEERNISLNDSGISDIHLTQYEGRNGSLNVLEISDIHRTLYDKFHLLMDKVDDLKLHNIQDLIYLDGKPQLHFTPSGAVSFCKLTYLSIDGCGSMKYLFSPSCVKAFQQLKLLHVENCGRMEQIIGVGDHYNEEEVEIDEVIIFRQLTRMILVSLSQFRCFCPKMKKATIERNSLNSAEFIFNEKVSFPVLEELYIAKLSTKYLFSLSCVKAFQQLKLLHVENCDRMEQIIGVGDHYNEEEVGIDDVIIFSRLTKMTLKSLPQFRCFCSQMKKATIERNSLNSTESIFNEKVSFPVLETLYITQIPVKSLFFLSYAKAFQQLKELRVKNCGRMEQIIGVGDHYNEEKVEIDEVIIFSRLTMIELWSLPQFRCFCPRIKKATIEENSLNSAEFIFNEKVSFPMLEILHIIGLSMKYLFSPSDVKAFQQLKQLRVADCGRMEQIIGVGDHYNEEEIGIGEIIIFSRLTRIILWSLPQFRCFCPKMKKAAIEENLLNSAEFIFDEKVSFPVIERLNIIKLPVKILFSLSCVKGFQLLKELHVDGCDRMEQIIGVGDHYNEEEMGIDEVIIFSRLTMMNLWSLPQFRCFWPKMKKITIERSLLNSEESIIDEKISFPVLERLDIDQLPVKYLFSLSCVKAFQQLKELDVRNCGKMEQIIGVGDHDNEEEVVIDEVIIFSRLTVMNLRSLPQFRCFCPKMKITPIEGNLLNSAEFIIDEKVSFPVLNRLNISQLPVKNIWNKETI